MQTFATSPDLLKPDDKFIIEFFFCEEDEGKWVLRKESENQLYEVRNNNLSLKRVTFS